MRIASKLSLPKQAISGVEVAFFLVLGACLVAPVDALAAEPAGAATSQLPALAIVDAPVAPVVTVPGNIEVASSVAPSSGTAKVQGESIEKSLTKTEDKVVESAKEAVKRLDVATEDTTLAELNLARQTITRIEAMIDVEKRLNELEKLRTERRGGGRGASALPASLASAIPASALGMPPGAASLGEGNPEEQRIRPAYSGRPKIVRISGTGGKYTAVLKFSGDDVKSLRVGDKVSDGATVRSITSSSVEIGGKGNSYTLHVKNVDVVHSVVR